MKLFFTVSLLAFVFSAGSQQPYVQGSLVADFPMERILNYTASATSLGKIKKDVTIIDFFGTWCIPCIKALPHLKELQQKYQDRLQVVLVSVEEEQKLQNFLAKQTNFTLPLVVDKNSSVTNLFQPPSYPYSIVLDSKGVVLALLSDASGLTNASISSWLSKGVQAPATPLAKSAPQKPPSVSLSSKSTNPLVLLSQDFIYAAKTGDPLSALQVSIKEIPYTTLRETLKTDEEKKAFWINIYNGFTNAILKASPEKYENRNRFFGAKQIPVAGETFSLDQVEHDILRRSKIKWSLGYFNRLFPSKRSRELRVDSLDYRIHFALNCGAKSCPPIAYYTPEGLDAQLEVATKNYLGSEVSYDKETGIVRLPALMSWFRADFGGKKGMIEILKKHAIIPQEAHPKIRFKKYDWTLELNNYKIQ
ncbi:MAG TPA: DUF547 domain-containing protein [Flavisolibacter sp.]|nr:DUF547 domain-containing protein [Flavisolibacter sp.]